MFEMVVFKMKYWFENFDDIYKYMLYLLMVSTLHILHFVNIQYLI